MGNPAPDWNGDIRMGDNLYTDSAIALNPDTGEMKWYFQFTPHDEWDWDAVQIPVLADIEFKGQPRKVILWANRNGFYYTLDRTNGEFLVGKNFAQVTWAKGLDEKGKPIKIPEASPRREGTRVYPGVQGATNWYAPSFSPRTGLFYLSAWEFSSVYHKGDPTYTRGNRYIGSLPQGVWPDVLKDEVPGWGAIRALDPQTGDLEWEFKMTEVSESGLLATATDVLFSGDTVYRPDIVMYLADRLPPHVGRLDKAPDLIVEVLSPGTKPLDLVTKRDDYGRFGVGEYWAVDPATAEVRCWRRDNSRFVDAPVEGDSLACAAIPGLSLDLRPLRRLIQRD